MPDSKIGEMAWLDLTVEHASQVKDFYQQVIGWQVEQVSMGDYDDYSMMTPDGKQAVTGICHAKGPNAELPPMWIPYFLIDDIEMAVANVVAQGGELITEINAMGKDKYVMIKDPAGAACALYQKGR